MTDSRQQPYPLLIAITKENIPRQITFHGLTEGRFKNVRLPKRLAWLKNERKQAIIKWFIKSYLRRFNGYCPFWGKAIAFQYSDSNVCYNINLDATSFVEIDVSQKMVVGVAYASI